METTSPNPAEALTDFVLALGTPERLTTYDCTSLEDLAGEVLFAPVVTEEIENLMCASLDIISNPGSIAAIRHLNMLANIVRNSEQA